MFKHISAAALLMTILGALATLAVAVTGARVWSAWEAVQQGGRILAVANASENAFTAMLNIRTDRSSVPRTWNEDAPASAEVLDFIRPSQIAEMAALATATAQLQAIDFAERDALLPALAQTQQRLIALQKEFWDGAAKPKSLRRPGLASAYVTEGLALQDTLEKISARIFAAVRHSDAFVDQMLDVKQLAWLARDRAGEASLLISQGLAKGSLPPGARTKYDTYEGAAAAAWSGIDDLLFATVLPEQFTAAIADAKRVFFAADYAATRERLMTALIDGGPKEMTADKWSPYTVPKLGAMQAVATGALAAARDHAEAARAAAWWNLCLAGAMLVAIVLFAIVSMVTVVRRVTGPLGRLRDAMLQLAGGDLAIEPPFADRGDEIGTLAGAMAKFRAAAVEKAAIDVEQKERRLQAAERQSHVDTRIAGFEGVAKTTLDTFDAASGQMGHASVEMAEISARTSTRVREVALAAEEASGSVAGIAAATDQLTASIHEISRQVSQATEITGRAVDETRQTDDTVRGLSQAAAKIGAVVTLIRDIAGQTNLLALNATIEAARAGDAGKGFAVVASEVKSLASQTAKATEEIAAQISAVRGVTEAAVIAIERIGVTIAEVSTVANSIAAGVEQQGAATQEIARGTQEAARRTQEVTASVAGVSADAEAAGHTAGDVKAAGEALQDHAGQLRKRVEEFLHAIRAA